MLYKRMGFPAVLLLLVGSALATDVLPGTVTIEGHVAKGHTWTAAQLKSDFARDLKTVKYTARDGEHSAQAVPLIALVDAAAPKIDPQIKNHSLRFVVVVEGTDGYMATFALTEIAPEVGNRAAWVLLDRDNKPLPERDAPVSLIVPDDQKPERWVRSIKTIRVVDIGTVHTN